jgi:hypothetical protein
MKIDVGPVGKGQSMLIIATGQAKARSREPIVGAPITSFTREGLIKIRSEVGFQVAACSGPLKDK